MFVSELPRELQPLRLIIPAMATGMIAFGIVTVFLAPVGEPGALRDVEKWLLLALLALPVMELPAFFAVRFGLLKKLQGSLSGKKPRECIEPIAAAYMQIHLIGAAMAEGIGLFGIVIVLLTGNWLPLLAPLLALLVLASLFPWLDGFQSFAADMVGRLGL